MESLEDRLKDCNQVLLPIFAEGHWVLLQVSLEKEGIVRFADSLNGPPSAAILQSARDALKFLKLLPTWSWVSTAVPPRWNKARQGPLECGFFVASWLERIILKAAGKEAPPLSAAVDVGQLKGRLLNMLETWGPTMKRLQREVPSAAGRLEAQDRPPAVSTQATLEADLRSAAAGFRTGLEPTGDAARVHRLEDYPSTDEWAAVVMELLSEEHKALCTEVALKEADGTPCKKKCSKGCWRCVFWMAVRYWRNVELGGKATEGYDSRSCGLARLKGNVGSQVHLEESSQVN